MMLLTAIGLHIVCLLAYCFYVIMKYYFVPSFYRDDFRFII